MCRRVVNYMVYFGKPRRRSARIIWSFKYISFTITDRCEHQTYYYEPEILIIMIQFRVFNDWFGPPLHIC